MNNKTEEVRPDAARPLTAEETEAFLARPETEEAIFANERLCNAIITRFLSELYEQRSAPVVRGRSALSPLPRPHTLQEAKRIVDTN